MRFGIGCRLSFSFPILARQARGALAEPDGLRWISVRGMNAITGPQLMLETEETLD